MYGFNFPKLPHVVRAFAITACFAMAQSSFAVSVDFRTQSAWPGGSTQDVVITNDTGAAINNWVLSFKMGVGIQSIWRATATGSDPYTIKPFDYNNSIPAGGTQNFGFNASGGIVASALSSCVLNGKACTFKINGVTVGSSSSISSSSRSSVVSSSARSSSSSSSSRSSASSSSARSSSSSSTGSSSGLGGVSTNGALKVVNGQVVNKNGDSFALHGMSSHGLQWDVNQLNGSSATWLKEDWGINLVRGAMYVREGGYLDNSAVKTTLFNLVDAAITNDLYVMIDWHILNGDSNDPLFYVEQAKTFFDEASRKYANNPNVIYEIANEPNGSDRSGRTVGWSSHIKPYAEQVIPVIRRNAPNALIVVGTPNWSQFVDDAANDPVKKPDGTAYANIAYSVHFYACTHGQWLRDRVSTALGKGAAVFVSEWGTGDASGAGSVCEPQTREWATFMTQKKLPWANWSVANKDEATAALKPGVNTSRRWTDNDLSISGKLVKSLVK